MRVLRLVVLRALEQFFEAALAALHRHHRVQFVHCEVLIPHALSLDFFHDLEEFAILGFLLAVDGGERDTTLAIERITVFRCGTALDFVKLVHFLLLRLDEVLHLLGIVLGEVPHEVIK